MVEWQIRLFERGWWAYLLAPRALGAPSWRRVIECRRSQHLAWWYVEEEPIPDRCPNCRDPVPRELVGAVPGYERAASPGSKPTLRG